MSGNGLGDFLRARRESTSPSAGEDRSLRRRRTPGLRREEVASRAGISADYYARLEQGRERHPSPQVLAALVRALELNIEESTYLHEMARPRTGFENQDRQEGPGEYLLMVMNAWPFGPAYIINERSDILAQNSLAHLLFDQFEVTDNVLRMLFLDPGAKTFWVDWESYAHAIVGGVRATLGPDVDQPAMARLIDELTRGSDDFAQLWSSQHIDIPRVKHKSLSHRDLGHLDFDYELMTAMSDPRQRLLLHRVADGNPPAEPGAVRSAEHRPGGQT
jgi:transcriptional regulator with XRE-family HTH domain